MRNLTINEVCAVSGAQNADATVSLDCSINWFDAGVNAAAGAVGGSILGFGGFSIYNAVRHSGFNSAGALRYTGYGLVAGLVVGGVYSCVNEAIKYYNS